MLMLLQDMSFHLLTDFGRSTFSFLNNEDNNSTGQGVLQESSSNAPFFIMNSHVSLHTYSKLATGASFTHPMSRKRIHDKAIQYVDDTMQLLNHASANSSFNPNNQLENTDILLKHAHNNTRLWNDINWIFGGNLNLGKCYYYSFIPSYNFKKRSSTYKHIPLFTHLNTKSCGFLYTHNSARPPTTVKQSLGVFLAPDGSATEQMRITIS